MVDRALIDIGIYFSCPRSELNVVKWIELHECVCNLFVDSDILDLTACIPGLLLQRVHPSPSQIWGYQYFVYQDTYTISVVSRRASLIYGWGLYRSDWVENVMHYSDLKCPPYKLHDQARHGAAEVQGAGSIGGLLAMHKYRKMTSYKWYGLSSLVTCSVHLTLDWMPFDCFSLYRILASQGIGIPSFLSHVTGEWWCKRMCSSKYGAWTPSSIAHRKFV